jgi:hypothetical protein
LIVILGIFKDKRVNEIKYAFAVDKGREAEMETKGKCWGKCNIPFEEKKIK